MKLANHITHLLYRHDCVIVPNFGGFITNKIGAKLQADSHTFYPPAKQISFNRHLNINDGLLANYIASIENISYEKALDIISKTVANWNATLLENTLPIGSIGTLHQNEQNQLIFEPNKSVNFLSESFGLTAVNSNLIPSEDPKVKTLTPVLEKQNKKGIATFVKYAAAAAILVSLGLVGSNIYEQNKQQEILTNQEKALEQKIQSATFVISNPLPTIELNVVKEIATPYHVVAGAFQYPENAKRKVKQLQKQGYNAKIIGVNKWGLTQVVFNSFADKNDAINHLYKIQDTVSEDAWLLVKK